MRILIGNFGSFASLNFWGSVASLGKLCFPLEENFTKFSGKAHFGPSGSLKGF
jgi:hypothetical protein